MDTTNIDNVHVEGIDTQDYPDFVDSFIASADRNGIPMTESELEELSEDYDFKYEQIIKQIY